MEGIDISRLISAVLDQFAEQQIESWEITRRQEVAHQERIRLQQIRDNTIPPALTYIARTVDKPSRSFAAKIKATPKLPDNEKPIVPTSYCIIALNGTTLPHTIGKVGFTTAEFFQGDLTVQHERSQNLVKVVHASSWWIKDDDDSNDEHQIICENFLRDNYSIAEPAFVPYYIADKRTSLVKQAKNSPFPHQIVRRYSLFRTNHPEALQLLNTHKHFTRSKTDTEFSNLSPAIPGHTDTRFHVQENKTQWIFRCLLGEYRYEEPTNKYYPSYHYLLKQTDLQHLSWTTFLDTYILDTTREDEKEVQDLAIKEIKAITLRDICTNIIPLRSILKRTSSPYRTAKITVV